MNEAARLCVKRFFQAWKSTMKQHPQRHAAAIATRVHTLARGLLPALALTGVLLLQACNDLPEWLTPKPALADATGKAMVDCRDGWPLNAQDSNCDMQARNACAGPVIYMRTVSSSGPHRPQTWTA